MPDKVDACSTCGAVLADVRRHRRWHRDLESHTTRFVGLMQPGVMTEPMPEPPPAHLSPTEKE